jgi:hypothetical protein
LSVSVKWSSAFLGLAAVVFLLAPVLADPAGAALRSGFSVESAIAAPTPGTTFTTPTDGRLRGQDFAATVTGVAWPDRATIDGRTVEATPGHRFVAFNLQLAEDASAVAPDGNDPAVTVAVQWSQGSYSLPLTTIGAEIANQALTSTWASGSAQFAVSVPNRLHTVDLVVHQGSWSQSFNLWTLRRDSIAPAVLFRDASRPTLSSSAPASTTLTMTNPSDGFSSTAQVDVQSATLTYFSAPGGGGPVIFPNQAMLNLIITGKYPVDVNDATVTGHYLGSQSPLPGNLLTFTPAGGAAVTPTLNESGYTTGQADDDGLFDALYSFVVPASLTTGTLTIGPGSFTGTEFTLYTAEDGNTTINLTAPTSVVIAFPALPAVAHQTKPPWIGAALPPTATPSSSSAAGNPLTTSPGKGFPIWLAILLLVILGAGAVVAQRLFARRRLVSNSGPVVVPMNVTPAPGDAAVLTLQAEEQVSSATVPPIPSAPAPSAPMLGVLGPVTFDSYRQTPDRRVIEELLSWLVLHSAHSHNADEIQLALRPTESSRSEVTRKTFHSYLSGLRQCIGAEHLPDATGAAGYRISGIDCDWFVFTRLCDEADTADGPRSIELRKQALALVRGAPFQGVVQGQYEWVFSEDLHTHMANAVITCALRLANDLMALGRYKEAEEAATAGLRGAPRDPDLQRVRSLAVASRNEGLVHPGRAIGDEAGPEEPEEPGAAKESTPPG